MDDDFFRLELSNQANARLEEKLFGTHIVAYTREYSLLANADEHNEITTFINRRIRER